MAFHAIAGHLISIESATLEFKSPPAGVGVGRHIYGYILIDGVGYKNVISLFKRTADDPQKSSSDNDLITPLNLCGPLFHLFTTEPSVLYVDLHDPNMGPLIHKRVLIRPQLRQLYNPNIPIDIVVPGQACFMTVSMISLVPSIIATTELVLEPPCPSHTATAWLVSGKVSAVQKSTYQERYQERTFPLFSRPNDDPARVLPNGGIPLDRDLVVAPVQIEYPNARFRPTDEIYDQESSITIRVDLNLVVDNGDPCFLGGAPEFEVKGTHKVGTRYEQCVVGLPKRKGNVRFTLGEKQSCLSPDVKLKTDKREEIESFVPGDPSMLSLKVYLTPIDYLSEAYMVPDIYKEPVEDSLDLYVSPEDDYKELHKQD